MTAGPQPVERPPLGGDAGGRGGPRGAALPPPALPTLLGPRPVQRGGGGVCVLLLLLLNPGRLMMGVVLMVIVVVVVVSVATVMTLLAGIVVAAVVVAVVMVVVVVPRRRRRRPPQGRRGRGGRGRGGRGREEDAAAGLAVLRLGVRLRPRWEVLGGDPGGPVGVVEHPPASGGRARRAGVGVGVRGGRGAVAVVRVTAAVHQP